jgi:serine protease Do
MPNHGWRRLVTLGGMAVLGLVFTGGGCAAGGDGIDAPPEIELRIAAARDRVFPALVNIDVLSVSYFNGKEMKGRSSGSGTIISPEGHVLTNAHVTDRGIKFWCTLVDKQRLPAELVGEDPLTDLAVLKLDLSRLRDPAKGVHVAELGDSDTVQIGDYVLAMGSPFALSRTVTLGIVSNNERVFTDQRDGELDDMALDGDQRTGMFTNWIQHDALINPGNSGGPLVDLGGQVVGVNTRGGAGMSFASPSNLARVVADAILAQGAVARSWIGLTFKPIENTGIERGVLIDSVEREGPAESAGIRAGDVLVAIDGRDITVRFPEEVPPLLRRVAETPVGDTIRLGFLRDGESISVDLVTDPLRRDRGDETALRTWGISVQQITERKAKQFRLPDTRGAFVTSVRSGGPAGLAEPAITWGDVIREIDGQPVEDMDSIIAAYERIGALKELPEYLLIRFDRQGEDYVTLIKPRPPEQQNPPPELPKGWIGIQTQPVIRNLAEKLGHPDQRGFRVIHIYGGTTAGQADLEVGDVILSLNGEAMAPRGMQDAGLLGRAIRNLKIDSQATLRILRQGEELDVPVTVEKTRTGAAEAKKERSNDFELVVREITFFDRDDNQWDDSIEGVLVDSAEPAGWAGLAGVRPGDLIQRIGESEIGSLADFKAAMETVGREQPERVVFVVLRWDRTYFKFAEPDWKPIVDEAGEDAAP